jgi:hypothetical protein
MGVFQNNLMGAAAAAASAGGGDFYSHQIVNSCRFVSGNSSYLTRTPGGAPSSDKICTISFWYKHAGQSGSNMYYFTAYSSDSSVAGIYRYPQAGAATDHQIRAFSTGDTSVVQTSNQFRDFSAWGHLVLRIDTTQSTDTDRVRWYHNGVLADISSTGLHYPDQNETTVWNGQVAHLIGGYKSSQVLPYDGYFAEFIMADGQSYAPTQFGESKNGVWIPKDPSGTTFGNNGFHLKFESSSDLGNDSSGNNNDFTVSSLSAHDQMIDTPTFNSSSNGGNFATLGPLWKTPDMTFSEGNLKANTTTNNRGVMSNWEVPDGDKWYWEIYPTIASGEQWLVGINYATVNFTSDRGGRATGVSYDSFDGKKRVDNNTASSYGSSWATGDIIGIAVDRVNDTIQFYKNGSGQGTIDISGINNTEFFPWCGCGGGSGDNIIVYNFGQDGTFAGSTTAGGNSDDTGYGNFKYSVPSGFKALCTGNLPVADAVDPAQTDDDYPQKLFNAIAYSGDGGGSFTTGFQPDLVWVKRRNGSQSNGLFDSSRGTSKVLNSDGTGEEATSSGLTSFDSTGYTMGNFYNQSGNTYVSWSWRANGGTTSTDSNGSVSSTVQADPSGSFSMVKFIGGISGAGTETVGHGLNKAPSLIMNFCYDDLGGGDGNRWVRSDGLTNWNYVLKLNGNAAPLDKSGNGNMSAPTSTVFSINNTDILGAGSQKIISYCFANSDWIKSGKYEGNGNADGPFVYTGFRPALVVNKRIDSTGHWLVHDDARDTYNPSKEILLWSGGDAEFNSANDRVDFLSNGFKMRSSNTGINGSGNDYIYLAMAHNPFKYATAR